MSQSLYCELTTPQVLVEEVLKENFVDPIVENQNKNDENDSKNDGKDENKNDGKDKNNGNAENNSSTNETENGGTESNNSNSSQVTQKVELDKGFIEENMTFIAIVSALIFLITIVVAITCCVIKCINARAKVFRQKEEQIISPRKTSTNDDQNIEDHNPHVNLKIFHKHNLTADDDMPYPNTPD